MHQNFNLSCMTVTTCQGQLGNWSANCKAPHEHNKNKKRTTWNCLVTNYQTWMLTCPWATWSLPVFDFLTSLYRTILHGVAADHSLAIPSSQRWYRIPAYFAKIISWQLTPPNLQGLYPAPGMEPVRNLVSMYPPGPFPSPDEDLTTIHQLKGRCGHNHQVPWYRQPYSFNSWIRLFRAFEYRCRLLQATWDIYQILCDSLEPVRYWIQFWMLNLPTPTFLRANKQNHIRQDANSPQTEFKDHVVTIRRSWLEFQNTTTKLVLIIMSISKSPMSKETILSESKASQSKVPVPPHSSHILGELVFSLMVKKTTTKIFESLLLSSQLYSHYIAKEWNRWWQEKFRAWFSRESNSDHSFSQIGRTKIQSKWPTAGRPANFTSPHVHKVLLTLHKQNPINAPFLSTSTKSSGLQLNKGPDTWRP